MTELEKKAKEMQDRIDEFKSFLDEFNGDDGLKKKFEELKTKFEGLKIPDLKDSEELKSLDEALNGLKTQVEELEKKNKSNLSVKDAVIEVLESKDFKTAFEKGECKGLEGKTFELKVDTSDFIADVSRTQVKPGATYTREFPLTVMPLFNVIPMSLDKSRMSWIEGAYTSNVGYVGEGTANGTDDTAKEEEKYREIAKVSAKLRFTEEIREDAPAFAARAQMKISEFTQKFVNKELITGDGNDSTQKKHIYGLLTQGSTAFAAGDLADSYKAANIDDLCEAIQVQADAYTPDVVIMNKLTKAKYSRVKASDGQYVIREVNGTLMMGGMNVVVTANDVMPNNALLAVERATLELWVKRNLQLKVGQEQNDLSTDRYTVVVFWRGQSLVETPNKAANIYVADIDAALVALDPDRT